MVYFTFFLYLCGAVGMYIHLNEDNVPDTEETYLLDLFVSAFWFALVPFYAVAALWLIIKESKISTIVSTVDFEDGVDTKAQ